MIIMNKYSADEAKRRGIDGTCMVVVYDGSMGFDTSAVIIDWVSKPVARSIATHMNRQVPDGMDIWYHAESRDDREPDLSYWR